LCEHVTGVRGVRSVFRALQRKLKEKYNLDVRGIHGRKILQ